MARINNLVLNDVEEAKRISSRIAERKIEMDATKTSANNSLEALKAIVKCDGITETLTSLEEAITENSAIVNNLLDRISLFINEQVTAYEISTQETATGVNNEINKLDMIQ